MKRRPFLWMFSTLLACSLSLNAQGQEENSFVHHSSTEYEWPTDPYVLAKLDKWQDQKFGVLFHWGVYSVPGIVESWQICNEDWITRPDTSTYEGYKQWYWGLSQVFRPTQFDPKDWATVMRDAGMRYMIFTTKHHDGFCMYDSKYTDFSIAKGPFASDPQRDVARHVFNAFRAQGFMVGCYFSKPDWHCPYYWTPYYATPDRHQNYKRDQHPDWWAKYQQFTQNQLTELLTGYGPFDILWLDGGWVTGEEVGLPQVLAQTRVGKQKDMLVVDRTIKGKYENYQTPERSVPDHQMDHPWESCIPLSHSWAWAPDAKFKSPNEVVALLAEITAKGGCLVLGVGPTPQGTIQPEVKQCLHQVGQWLRANGEAIYGTRITPHYHEGNLWFTASKDHRTRYAICTLPEGQSLPQTLTWHGNVPRGKMTLLSIGRTVKYSVHNDEVTVQLPAGLPQQPVALRFTAKSSQH